MLHRLSHLTIRCPSFSADAVEVTDGLNLVDKVSVTHRRYDEDVHGGPCKSANGISRSDSREERIHRDIVHGNRPQAPGPEARSDAAELNAKLEEDPSCQQRCQMDSDEAEL